MRLINKLNLKLNKIFQDNKYNFSKNDENKIKIICYIPKNCSNWIINFLFKDISKASKNNKVEYVICKNLIKLFFYNLNPKCKIICLHQNFLKRINFIGINLEKVSVYYTHTRLDKTNINLIKKVKNVFVLNSNELCNLRLYGINEKKLVLFHNGFDNKLFYHRKLNRDIDFLFVCKYVDKYKEEYYWARKNTDLLIKLAEKLSNDGFKVVVLGKNWKKFKSSCKFNILDLNHINYPEIYSRSKIYISPSIQEGGPVSWVEAMASGCFTLSYQTGFASELRDKELMSWVLPLSAEFNLWYENCIKIHSNFSDLLDKDLKARKTYLEKFKFAYLANLLESKLI